MNQTTNDPPVYFSQPLLQTAMIFLGEIVCIVVIQLASKAPSLLDHSILQAVAPSSPPPSQHPQSPTSQQQQQHASQPGYGDHPDWAAATRSSNWALIWFIVPSACDLIATTVSFIFFFFFYEQKYLFY